MPNPAPDTRPSASRDELRARFGIEGNTLVFAGRLTAQKSLPVLLEAVAQIEDVSLRDRRRRRRASNRRRGDRATRARSSAFACSARFLATSVHRSLRRRRCDRALLELGELPAHASSNRSPSGRPSSRRGPVVLRRLWSMATTACSFPSVTQHALAAAIRRYFGDERLACEPAGERVAVGRPSTARSTCSATSSTRLEEAVR